MSITPPIRPEANAVIHLKNPGTVASFKPGTVLKAQVISTSPNGRVSLNISPPGGNTALTAIKAFSEVPLVRGQTIYLIVVAAKDGIQLKFAGNVPGTPATVSENIPATFIKMFEGLSRPQLNRSDLNLLLKIFNALPDSVKTTIPGLEHIARLFGSNEDISEAMLKKLIRASGIAYETKLRLALHGNQGSLTHSLLALQAEGDLKAILLRLKKMLRNKGMTKSLQGAGLELSLVSTVIDKFIRNIEFYQLTSRMHEMFHTFLPLLWEDLNDSEFMFHKKQRRGGTSYSCDINLDFKKLGKISASLSLFRKAFFITLYAEREDVTTLIESQKHILHDRFTALGLTLKALTVHHKTDILFGKAAKQGVTVKI